MDFNFLILMVKCVKILIARIHASNNWLDCIRVEYTIQRNSAFEGIALVF